MKARNYGPIVVAQAGGLNLKLNLKPNLAQMKPTLPFGQIPYLEHGDVKLAQSGAIIRYLAKLGSIDGRNSDQQFAMSEMLIEEMQDLFTMVHKAYNSPDRVSAFNELFAKDSKLASQLLCLEKLVQGVSFCVPPQAGDYCIAAALDIIVHLEPTALSSYPKLSAFYKTMLESAAFATVKDYPMFFNRNPNK